MKTNLSIFILLGLFSLGCESDENPPEESPFRCASDDADVNRPEAWTEESHCKGATPNYELLFDETEVKRLDITLNSGDYDEAIGELDGLLGGFGSGIGDPSNPTPERKPMYIPATIDYEGNTWTDVAMRYKGSSSLTFSWRQGVAKLAFRLHFDKFADDVPELENQRFFGFKKMTFANGFDDPSLIREKISYDILRESGIAVASSAFVRVFVDHGEGPVYFGLYTMIEDPSDAMLDQNFTDGSGNLYKPEGPGADWTEFNEEGFKQKTNKKTPDWSSIEAAIAALHADRSTPEDWRAGLEATFDVRGFLGWLAVNQAMLNWDTYGRIAHNYYLYSDPSQNGKLTWIPWDQSESMRDRSGLIPAAQGADSVMLDELDAQWPLIRFLLDDEVYRQFYVDELESILEGAFSVQRVQAKLNAYHDLVAPYAVGPDGEAGLYTFLRPPSVFTTSLTAGPNALGPHVEARHQAVLDALAQENN